MKYNYNFEMLTLPNDSSNISFDKSVDEILLDNSTNTFTSNTDYKDGVKVEFEALKKMIQDQKK